MTDDDLVKAMAAELEVHEGPLTVVLRPLTAFELAGLLQLALRHPEVSEPTRVVAVTFIEHVRAFFAGCPTVLEVLRRGDNPNEDI